MVEKKNYPKTKEIRSRTLVMFWVMCGTLLYRFQIFALFLILKTSVLLLSIYEHIWLTDPVGLV